MAFQIGFFCLKNICFLHVFSWHDNSVLLSQNNILPCKCTTVSFSIHLMKHISIALIIWQSWIRLLLTTICIFLHGQKFLPHLGPKITIAGYYQKSTFSFCHTIFQSVSTIFHSCSSTFFASKWYVVGRSQSLPHVPLKRLPECLHDMVAGFPQN